jgi:CMP-N,N'-diacetyllegionaminic acid synthase
MDYLALIPARSGSKGIVNKNIQDLNGFPMVAYTFYAAINSKLINSVHLSSNDKDVIKIAKKYNIEVPFVRPESLSSDKSTTLDVVLHFLNWFKKENKFLPKNFILLQPTSPLRDSDDIDNAINKFEKNKTLSLFSACEVSQHPFEMFHIDSNNSLEFFYQKANSVKIKTRQHYRNVYFEDGAIYICNTKWFLKNKVFYNNSSSVTILNKKHSIDIDTFEDLTLARTYLK